MVFSFSGEAILGTQRCLEARFSTIAVSHPLFFCSQRRMFNEICRLFFFLLTDEECFSTLVVCLAGYYRGSQYVFLISIFRASGRRVVILQNCSNFTFSRKTRLKMKVWRWFALKTSYVVMPFSKTCHFPTSIRLWVLKLLSANTMGIAGYKIQNLAARSPPGSSPGSSPAVPRQVPRQVCCVL